MRQILAGSRKHFDLLYEAYFPRVFRFALKQTQGEPSFSPPRGPIDAAVDTLRILDLTQCTLEQLSPLQRRIFHLRHLRQQSVRAIAGALGKSEDAVKTNLIRMRRALVTKTPGLDQLLHG
ncbi:MAG: RNA polymerase sigma factor [Myxococcota bacterium]